MTNGIEIRRAANTPWPARKVQGDKGGFKWVYPIEVTPLGRTRDGRIIARTPSGRVQTLGKHVSLD